MFSSNHCLSEELYFRGGLLSIADGDSDWGGNKILLNNR